MEIQPEKTKKRKKMIPDLGTRILVFATLTAVILTSVLAIHWWITRTPDFTSLEDCGTVCAQKDFEYAACVWAGTAPDYFIYQGVCQIKTSTHCSQKECNCYCYQGIEMKHYITGEGGIKVK